MKKGTVLYLIGAFLLVLGPVLGFWRVNDLFLPTTGEVFSALVIPILLVVAGIVLFVLGFVIPSRMRRTTVAQAELAAEGHGFTFYSFDAAAEALEARITAWENTASASAPDWQRTLSILRTIHKQIIDLGKMSKWFSISLDKDLYSGALDAVYKVDSDKLRALSGFLSYCSTVTEYELRSTHFAKACDNAVEEMGNALELYASMRSKLSSFSGSAADRERLKAEIEQISGVR